MVARAMLSRVEALEHEHQKPFTGYAVLHVYSDQTLEQAKAEWIEKNGPLGNRQWVIDYNER